MSWYVKKLGEVLKIQNGYAFDSKLFSVDGLMPLIRIRDIKKGIKTETCYSGNFDKKYVVKKGDLLIGMDGEFGCYEWKGEDALLNQRVCRLQNFEKIIYPRFLLYGINSYLKAIEDITGFTTVKHISSKQIANIDFPLPQIAIQKKIVAKLDAIFAEIDTATAAAEANAKNAEALFQSYVTEIFESKKYDFKLVKFGTTASFVRGPFGGSLKKSIFVEKGYAVYEQQHAIYNQFSDIRYFIDKSKYEEMKRFELKSGDLIMSCSGTMGKVAIVPENIEQGVINQALLKISPNKNVMGDYIARLLSSKYFQDILTKLSGGAAIQNVPAVSVLKEIEVPVPSINNQKLIIDIIDVLESNKSIIKNSYKNKSKELAFLKQSILQKAFSGELVKD